MYLSILKKIVVPITKLVSSIRPPWSEKEVKEINVRQAINFMQPCDLILTIDNKYFISNLFQKIFSNAKWFHIGMVSGPERVIEATTYGVVESGIYDFLMTKDDFLIIRPTFISGPDDLIFKDIVAWAREKLGMPYDWALDYSGNEEWYCSELIAKSYEEVLGLQSKFVLRRRYGVLTATPTDFYNAIKSGKFERVLKKL